MNPTPATRRKKPKKIELAHCACCGAEVKVAPPPRKRKKGKKKLPCTTVRACDDCLRQADLRGQFICRDVDHVGDRVIVDQHLVARRSASDPLIDICVVCWQSRHPYRMTKVFEQNPYADLEAPPESPGDYVEAERQILEWMRNGR